MYRRGKLPATATHMDTAAHAVQMPVAVNGYRHTAKGYALLARVRATRSDCNLKGINVDRTRPASLTDDTSEGASWSYGYAETATHTSCGGAAAPASSPPAQSARARQPAAARPEPYVQTKSDASGHAPGRDPWALTVSLLEELAHGTSGSDDASVAPEQPSNRVPARVFQQHAGDDI